MPRSCETSAIGSYATQPSIKLNLSEQWQLLCFHRLIKLRHCIQLLSFSFRVHRNMDNILKSTYILDYRSRII
jgi:hypothetical protein